jgi:hypothetical protein
MMSSANRKIEPDNNKKGIFGEMPARELPSR